MKYDKQTVETTLLKSVDEKRVALWVVATPGVYDAHNTKFTPDAVENGCYQFNLQCNQGNYQHVFDIDSANILESYVTPCEMNIEGTVIPEGTWLQKWYFPESDAGETLWRQVKNGEITGLSVGCTGKIVYEEE